jgi:hypothetical protein
VVGVGVTAYPRSGLADFIPSYRIVCLKKTGDLSLLRRKMQVFCLEEELKEPLKEADTSLSLLRHARTRKYLRGLPRPVSLILYQSYPELEALAGREKWRLLANPSALWLRASDRAFFQDMLNRLHISAIPGRIVSFKRFRESAYFDWEKEFGPCIALQLPEVYQGGGRSTFFVESKERFEEVKDLISSERWMDRKIKRVSIRKYMRGDSASLAVCITKNGTLVSGLQNQVIDPPLGGSLPNNGVFYGHSWGSFRWSHEIRDQARAQALKVSRFLASMGYHGIFGLDLVIDRTRSSVHLVELNPRLTGAFPVLTQLQASRGDFPMELAHVLTLLRWNIPIDQEMIDSGEPLRGGHLIIFRGFESGFRETPPRAGLYKMDSDSGLNYLGEEWEVQKISGTEGFIFVDGPPLSRLKILEEMDLLHRIGRLIFPFPIQEQDGRLAPSVVAAFKAMSARIFGPRDSRGRTLPG